MRRGSKPSPAASADARSGCERDSGGAEARGRADGASSSTFACELVRAISAAASSSNTFSGWRGSSVSALFMRERDERRPRWNFERMERLRERCESNTRLPVL